MARLSAAMLALAASSTLPAIALGQRPEIETFHVQGNIHMLVGAGANVAVQTGDDGVLVVDTGSREAAADVLAAIRRLSDKPIRWIINTHAHADHTGGNETISQAGVTVNGNPAAIISHERTLARMSDAGRSVTELPLTTFFEEGRDFYFNGEAIFLRHIPRAHTDGDIIVYFRGSDVLVAGDVFVTTTYPIIDDASDGSVEGFLDGLNTMLDIIVPKYLQEGGTYIVPGHGRVADEADVVAYRDMVLFVRDRVRAMRQQGMTVEQVIAAEPVLDYAPRYDKGGEWTTPMFVEAVYATVEP
jgi:glyoxylase-like metal-dependent hydrolase (beta-lactamase superfamily II)